MNRSPRRKNIRLKNYDYSQPGYYFITICCKDRIKYLGEIDCRDGALLHPIMELSNIGHIVKDQWYELINRYPSIKLDQFIVMPNHIHGIIIIDNVRAEQGPAPTISTMVCAFKSITTKLVNKADNSPGRRIWQSNYYDHIIRNEEDLLNIRKYIESNPLKWDDDKYFT